MTEILPAGFDEHDDDELPLFRRHKQDKEPMLRDGQRGETTASRLVDFLAIASATTADLRRSNFIDPEREIGPRLGHRFATAKDVAQQRGYVIEKQRCAYEAEYLGAKREPLVWYTLVYAPPEENPPLPVRLQEFYYHTSHWRELRKMRLKRDEWRCALCKAPNNLQCHHLIYGDMFGEAIDELITLCDRCHTWFHENRITRKFWAYAPRTVLAQLEEMFEKSQRKNGNGNSP